MTIRGKRGGGEVCAGGEDGVETGGEEEKEGEGSGHGKEKGEPAATAPEMGDVCYVGFGGEARVDGAESDDADDAEDDDDGALYGDVRGRGGRKGGRVRT